MFFGFFILSRSRSSATVSSAARTIMLASWHASGVTALDLVELQPLGGGVDEVEDVVERGGQRVDVLAVHRRDERGVELLEDPMRDLVAVALGLLDHHPLLVDIGIVLQQVLELPRALDHILRLLDEHIEELFFSWYESQAHYLGLPFSNRSNSISASVNQPSMTPAAISAAIGIVSTQAQTIRPATPHFTAESRWVEPTPTIAPVIVCVVLTGMPGQGRADDRDAPGSLRAEPADRLELGDAEAHRLDDPPAAGHRPQRDRGRADSI